MHTHRANLLGCKFFQGCPHQGAQSGWIDRHFAMEDAPRDLKGKLHDIGLGAANYFGARCCPIRSRDGQLLGSAADFSLQFLAGNRFAFPDTRIKRYL
jgi:hypothetical protein